MRVVMEPSNYRERVPPANVWALTPGQPIRNIDDASALAQAIVDTIRDPLLALDQDLRVPPANVWALPPGQPIRNIDDASALAQAIVDTIRDPLLVLDQDLRVVTANRAFCQAFRMSLQDIHGRPVYGLGDGQWDIPELRLLLEGVAPQHAVMEAYEVERDFPIIGRRSMLLNARELLFQKNSRKLILLAIEDVTDRRAAEREITNLLQQKETLLQEMQHRVANSLQIIASILSLKARAVKSEE